MPFSSSIAFPYSIHFSDSQSESMDKDDHNPLTVVHLTRSSVNKCTLFHSTAHHYVSVWGVSFPHLQLNHQHRSVAQDFITRDVIQNGGLLLHAAAVSLRSRSFLFPGPSGIGKSTFADLCRNHPAVDAVSDEYVFVYWENETLRFTGTDHWFEHRPSHKHVTGPTARVEACVFLEKGEGPAQPLNPDTGCDRLWQEMQSDMISAHSPQMLQQMQANTRTISHRLAFFQMPFHRECDPAALLDRLVT